jgi:hypothetical protein
MKKATVLILLGLLPNFLAAENRFTVTASANFLEPRDSGYQDKYLSSIFFPQLKLAYRAYDGFIVWVSYSYLRVMGKTAVVEADTKSTQNFLSFGAGYGGMFSEIFSWQLEAGLVNFDYKEEALGETTSGSSLGFSVSGTMFYTFGKMFVEAEAGYLYGKDAVNGTAIKLGGPHGGLGLGFRF